MDINAAATAIDQFLATYVGPGGLKPVEVQVRPSGDDADVIKVWIDLGAAGASADKAAWAKACEAAIAKAVPAATGARLQVRVESVE
jgi:hypothetical protein